MYGSCALILSLSFQFFSFVQKENKLVNYFDLNLLKILLNILQSFTKDHTQLTSLL